MKKYRFLKEGEALLPGDEAFDDDFNGGTWRVIGEIEGDEPITKMEELANEYRRSVPFADKVAFLVTISATTRVVLDCDGLSDDEIDERLAELACEKISANPAEYIIAENIDWEKTQEDTECPHVEPQYRFMEVGEKVLEGDLYLCKDGSWKTSDGSFSHTVKEHEAGRFQRKI
jgi:hypothetical protein